MISTLIKSEFFSHILTLVFCLISSLSISSIKQTALQAVVSAVLWILFYLTILYAMKSEKAKIPVFTVFVLPIYAIAAPIAEVRTAILPLVFLALPLVAKTNENRYVRYIAYSIVAFIVLVTSGEFNDTAHFITCALFVLCALGVGLFSRSKAIREWIENQDDPKKGAPQFQRIISSPIVNDPFGQLKKSLENPTSPDGTKIKLKLIETLDDNLVRDYMTGKEFESKGLLYSCIHDNAPYPTRTLLGESDDIPLISPFNQRIYFPIMPFDYDIEIKYILVIDSEEKKPLANEEIIKKFEPVKNNIISDIRYGLTFNRIAEERQKSAILSREISKIIDSFDHDELLKTVSLAFFNLVPGVKGVFFCEMPEDGGNLTGYALTLAEGEQKKWPYEPDNLHETAFGEELEAGSIHAMIIEKKLDEVFEAEDLNKRRSNPVFTKKFSELNRFSGISCRRLSYNNKVMGAISILTEKPEDFATMKGYTDSIRTICKVMASALNNIQMYKAVENLSITDALSSLYNRRFYDESLKNKTNEASRSGQPLSMIMVDIDHFKNINDTYGHLAGDQVIKMIGTCLKSNSRKYDICARYGGEEFVILTNMTLSVAEKLAEKIRKIVNDNITHYGDTSIHVSASFGVASFNESDPITAAEFQRRADAALYYSKTHGRNRVTLYSPDIEKQEEEEE